MALPELPAENEDPWFVKRNAFDQAVKSELEGRLSEDQLSATLGEVSIPKAKDSGDTFADVTRRLKFTDDVGARGSVVDIEHWGDGTNNSGQTWGVDIHNNPGAMAALWIHQYSDAQAAMQIDNTDTQTALVIKNTNNPVRNPDGAGSGESATGDFLRLVSTGGVPWVAIRGRGEFQINPPDDAVYPAIEVVGNASAAKKLLRLTANGNEVAFELIANAGSAGKYPMIVAGYDYGPAFTTSQDNGRTLVITKNGTGGGNVVEITNKGTDPTIAFKNATGYVSRINASGEYENLIASSGIILKSADGTRYRVRVANGGTVEVVAA